MTKSIGIDRDGTIEQVVVVPDGWTGGAGQWPLPAGTTAVPEGPGVVVGAQWDGEAWVPPDPPQPAGTGVALGNHHAQIRRRARALEEAGDVAGALLLLRKKGL